MGSEACRAAALLKHCSACTIGADIEFRVIAERAESDAIVAFEIGRSLFFLPFYAQVAAEQNAMAIARQLAQAIIRYRDRLRDEASDWTGDEECFLMSAR